MKIFFKTSLMPYRIDWCRMYSSFRPLNVVFYGSDLFSLESLKLLCQDWKKKENVIHDLAVVTAIKRPPNPIHLYSMRENIPIIPWPAPNPNNRYDIGVVVSFSHLIPQSIISSFPMGMINLHASLLPRWRGAAPIIYSILNGDQRTGVTVMRIEAKHFDIGDIILQQEVPIDPDIRMPELHNKLAIVGGELMYNCLRNIDESLSQSYAQPRDGVTYAPKVEGNALGQVKWDQMDSTCIYNLFRALYGFRPIWTTFHGHSIKLVEIRLGTCDTNVPELDRSPPGSFVYQKSCNKLVVKCHRYGFLIVDALRVNDKRSLSAREFVNGFVKKRPKTEYLFQ